MEDFIYILLAIVWLVVSIIGGRKKKLAQQAKNNPQTREVETYNTPTPTAKSEIEDMLEEFFGTGTSKPTPAPARQPEPVLTDEEYTPFQDYKPITESLETIEEPQYRDYQGVFTVSEDYNFSAESKNESMDELIRSYELSDQLAHEESAKLAVEDIHGTQGIMAGFEFEARKAIIYSEILNRKYS